MKWSANPVIYEINTWVWLGELAQQYGSAITLDTIPEEEWDRLSSLGFDAVWFMGVWERSPAGIAIAKGNINLLEDFRRALPDFRMEDNVGSPYCVKRYVVDEHLGGRKGLAVARRQLAKRRMRLVLDFVPNHVAPDHPWVTDHPAYFIRGTKDDVKNDPASFVQIGRKVFACGRDPYFPAWPDVLQLNAFNVGLRQAAIETLSHIAGQCDGVRCDMAMLMLNDVFQRTWGDRAGKRAVTEYWAEAISAVKKKRPDFIFLAEAYWGLEWELQQQGFDYCYDKRLYDRLEHDAAEGVRLHLCADLAYQEKLVRFIENHDEPRAAAAFPPDRERAAALAAATIPGAKLFHEGQLDGRTVRLPVFLGRRPDEPVDLDIEEFYRQLLNAMRSPALRKGEWMLCHRSGWPDNDSFLNIIAWCWRNGKDRWIIIINLSDWRSQALVRVPWDALASTSWLLSDAFTGETVERNGSEMTDPGIYVDLPRWGYHFFKISAGKKR